MKHLNIWIYGRVQGVFFRHFAQKEAQKLNITGFVKNIEDGSVYIEAEGDKKDLEKFLKYCKKGPLFAHVEKIESSEDKLKNFLRFDIK